MQSAVTSKWEQNLINSLWIFSLACTSLPIYINSLKISNREETFDWNFNDFGTDVPVVQVLLLLKGGYKHEIN